MSKESNAGRKLQDVIADNEERLEALEESLKMFQIRIKRELKKVLDSIHQSFGEYNSKVLAQAEKANSQTPESPKVAPVLSGITNTLEATADKLKESFEKPASDSEGDFFSFGFESAGSMDKKEAASPVCSTKVDIYPFNATSDNRRVKIQHTLYNSPFYNAEVVEFDVDIDIAEPDIAMSYYNSQELTKNIINTLDTVKFDDSNTSRDYIAEASGTSEGQDGSIVNILIEHRFGATYVILRNAKGNDISIRFSNTSASPAFTNDNLFAAFAEFTRKYV